MSSLSPKGSGEGNPSHRSPAEPLSCLTLPGSVQGRAVPIDSVLIIVRRPNPGASSTKRSVHQWTVEEQRDVLFCQVSDFGELVEGSKKRYSWYRTESGAVHPRDTKQLQATLNHASYASCLQTCMQSYSRDFYRMLTYILYYTWHHNKVKERQASF